ncbi:hypothetical protein CDB79_RS18775 [Vibrio parahaemolyticus]|uniref:hypothetical protein n=1 Tax=Vibrio parahaemolyticus TaxID=670 RepID=UPI000DFC7AAA|nr:hypothetical protein [Vibrio parahaemolyticus]EJG1710627.1 hypothetical protein [Vibrio parahaemolyticus]EJG1744004.1 hypothetical protein [Vibrio parahaemolyticus]EJG1781717.1 hypothetical protein [Vibrio parahaemolyticus]ELB1648107.1 hypothetical protein [Vibrio parahaemolyticus]SUP22534.1 Uncharacterised protein [Vibrio parahaemolyticus]
MSSVFARRSGLKGAYPLAAAAVVVACSPVFLTAGLAVPFASADGTSKFAGIATFNADNSAGADGELKVEVEKQQIALLNSGDIDDSHVGTTVYFSTENSVSIDAATASRPTAGVVSEVDGDLVWVQPAVV